MSKGPPNERPGTSNDDFYVTSGLRDLPERAITDLMYMSTMRHAFHPELRVFFKRTLDMYSKRKKAEGGVDFTEDEYEMPEIGEEYQFKVNEQREAAPIADDDAPGPAGPSSSVESGDDDDIICLDDVVRPDTAAPPPARAVDPLPAKTEEPEATMEDDDEIAIIDAPPKPTPVSITIDDDAQGENPIPLEESGPAATHVTRNPFASMFATDEDLARVKSTEAKLSPTMKTIETKDEPLASPSSSATIPFINGQPAVSFSRKRPRSPSPEVAHNSSRSSMVPHPALDNTTDELAQLQLKFMQDQNAMQNLPPIPKLDDLTSISEEAKDILLKQAQSKMVSNQLNAHFAATAVQPPPLVDPHSILNAEAFALPPTQHNHSTTSPIITAPQYPSSHSRMFETCAFCNLGHPSERCTRYPSFAQRETIAKRRRLCFHCLKVFDPVLCALIGHIKACEKCPGNHHPALCKQCFF